MCTARLVSGLACAHLRMPVRRYVSWRLISHYGHYRAMTVSKCVCGIFAMLVRPRQSLVRARFHANLAAAAPHNPGFQTVICAGSPGYALYPSVQVALVRGASSTSVSRPS